MSETTMTGTQFLRSTARHRIGTCPACRCAIFAQVDLRITVSPPTIDDQGKVSMYTNATPTAASFAHDCTRRPAACEHRDDDVPCGQPAPHVSLDRRTPLCDGHRETAPTEEMSA